MRYKEYNRNKVLEQSIEMFWKSGVNGCSINDLVEETGVNRFSLYSEFDNKLGMLYASFDLYKQRFFTDKLLLLNDRGDVAKIMYNFFKSFLQNSNKIKGCYIIHVGTELADTDDTVKGVLKDYLNEVKLAILQLLKSHGRAPEKAKVQSEHLLGLFCTAMSFCLIHSAEEQKRYLMNSINLILA